ncbi:MAG: metallophosphoesterase [Candidatus Omnitrophica bacterium]|nr:metallophosphoesterase [Candidatus Omnitrophota bacterium]
MRKFLIIFSVLILALTLYSLWPVTALYLFKSDPAPYSNDQAISRLKNNDGGYFKFIVTSDNHAGLIFDDSAALKLIGRMNIEDRFKDKIPIDFVMLCGDITFRGTPWQYRIFNRLRSIIKYPVIAAAGNHDDDFPKDDKLFSKYVGKREFSFTNRNCYFIVADNSTNDLTAEQFKWLEEELKKSEPYAHRFVVVHKQPLSSYQQSWYRPGLSKWSYKFMKLCEKYKVDMVLAGHEHMFHEVEHGGVKYVTCAGGGIIPWAPTWDGGYLHYLSIRVYGDYLDYEVRKVFPPFWEFLTYYMWKDLYYFFKDVIF